MSVYYKYQLGMGVKLLKLQSWEGNKTLKIYTRETDCLFDLLIVKLVSLQTER